MSVEFVPPASCPNDDFGRKERCGGKKFERCGGNKNYFNCLKCGTQSRGRHPADAEKWHLRNRHPDGDVTVRLRLQLLQNLVAAPAG